MDEEISATRRIWLAGPARSKNGVHRQRSGVSATQKREFHSKKVLGNLETGGVRGKYAIIEEASKLYPIVMLCKLLGVWRSAYYRYLERKNRNLDGEVAQQIQSIYHQRERTYGYRRITAELKRQYDRTVNHKKVQRIMQELGIRSIIRAKRPYFNAYPVMKSDGRVAPNLLNRDFTAAEPNEKWVTDVTQYRVGEQRLYLSAIKDLCGNDSRLSHQSS
ncbi:IS3 family transposase [Arthrobacter sp. NPDC058192]|uniref:IS3 family transposase n=1 Tax=Arthrobacter sp. NPDC058192 TaxID=3346372 RepID=UPI0036F1D068